MILEALCKYYDILLKEGIPDLPRAGYSMGKISFALILSKEGELSGVMDLREKQGKKLLPKYMLIPEQKGRSGKNPPAYFLCDNAKYALGINDDKGQSAFNRFKELHESFLDKDHSLMKFLSKWNPDDSFNNGHIQKYKAELEKNPNIIFKIEGNDGYVHEEDNILSSWLKSSAESSDGQKMQCLVTGEYDDIARIHTPIKGVRNAQAAGASIISFNDKTFCSYGKDSSYNAP